MTDAPREASKIGQFSWALFDWANQPFFTVVTTFIFAHYFANVMVGDPVKGQAAWAFTQSTTRSLFVRAATTLPGTTMAPRSFSCASPMDPQ